MADDYVEDVSSLGHNHKAFLVFLLNREDEQNPTLGFL